VPHWEIFVYEVLNYTDGKRSLAEIEDAVEAEFGDIPDGVVERILRDLEKVGLVEFGAPKAE
jgi:DNA-binding PadR family transcriptional regulator